MKHVHYFLTWSVHTREKGQSSRLLPSKSLMSESGFILDVRRGLVHLSECSCLRSPRGFWPRGAEDKSVSARP